MKILSYLIIFLGLSIASGCNSGNSTTEPEKPNIIYILADDLGYGDTGVYGQQKIATPNIDALADKGMLFTQHYAGSTVCAPSRSVLMTGLHSGHTFIRGNKEIKPEGQWPLEDRVLTIAERLKEAGYTTGAFGKWGLGFVDTEGGPNNQGFDVFFGYNCQRMAHNYYPYHLWENENKLILEGNRGFETGEYAPALIHKRAIKFIEDNAGGPFFLFYPSIIPHAELRAPEENMNKFRGKFLPEKEYKGTDEGRNYKNGGYGSQPESHAAFAAMIDLLDTHVGDIIEKVKELGIEENTIIMFSSDNGPHLEGGADPDFFDSNGPLRGYKRDLYEGGIRVPFIAAWPGKIQAGSTTDHISAFYDIFPTLEDIAGLDKTPGLDGISFLPSLKGKGRQSDHEYLYWEFHEGKGRVAVRMGDWKAVRYKVNEDPSSMLELYNLAEDIGEENNVAKDYPEIVKKADEIIKQARTSSEIFKSPGLDNLNETVK